MLQTIKLLMPALVPSWRFFDMIAPSPRIEFTVLKAADETPHNWREFCPRPEHISFLQMLRRMFWNPYWNETLFVMSCAERVMQNQSAHSSREILDRISRQLRRDGVSCGDAPYFQFRLVFISRQGRDLQRHVTFMSPVHEYSESVVE